MDDYLSKPVDRRLLEQCLALWLQRSPRRGGGAARPAMNIPAATNAPRPMMATGPKPPPMTPAAGNRPLPPRPAPTPPVPPMRPAAPVAPAAAPRPPLAPVPAPPAPAAPAGAAPTAARFAAAASAPSSAAPPPAGASVPVLEMEVIEELRSIMGDEYRGLVKLFLDDAPTHIEALRAAAANNDVAAMVPPAHTLKSSSANLGALALSSVAKRIEFGARTESLTKPGLAVLMLENEFRRAKAALTALLGG
jgi:HPt (histidine-containing phosphotransfer) domain-containing protein